MSERAYECHPGEGGEKNELPERKKRGRKLEENGAKRSKEKPKEKKKAFSWRAVFSRIV